MHPITRTTVILLFTAWCIDYIDRSVIGVALPLIGKDLGLEKGQLGLVISVFFLAYAAAQLPGGMLADKFGAMRIAVIGLIAWSIFTGLTALATSFVTLIAIRILFGLAQGIFPGAAMKLLAERSLPDERMTANGWVNSSNAIGVVMAMIVAAILLPLVGWRGMFLVISIFGIVITFVFIKGMPAPMHDVPANDVAKGRTAALLRTPAMWWFALAFFGYDILIWGWNAWTATYLQEEFALSPSASALLALPPGLAAALMIVMAGRYSDKIGGNPIRLIVPGMTIAGLLVISLPFLPNVFTYVAATTLIVGLASSAYIGSFSIPIKQLDPKVTGIAAGMILLGGMIAGVLSPTIVGFLAQNSGWTAAWMFLGLGAVVSVIAAYAAPRNAEAFRARVPSSLLYHAPATDVVPGKDLAK